MELFIVILTSYFGVVQILATVRAHHVTARTHFANFAIYGSVRAANARYHVIATARTLRAYVVRTRLI